MEQTIFNISELKSTFIELIMEANSKGQSREYTIPRFQYLKLLVNKGSTATLNYNAAEMIGLSSAQEMIFKEVISTLASLGISTERQNLVLGDESEA